MEGLFCVDCGKSEMWLVVILCIDVIGSYNAYKVAHKNHCRVRYEKPVLTINYGKRYICILTDKIITQHNALVNR